MKKILGLIGLTWLVGAVTTATALAWDDESFDDPDSNSYLDEVGKLAAVSSAWPILIPALYPTGVRRFRKWYDRRKQERRERRIVAATKPRNSYLAGALKRRLRLT